MWASLTAASLSFSSYLSAIVIFLSDTLKDKKSSTFPADTFYPNSFNLHWNLWQNLWIRKGGGILMSSVIAGWHLPRPLLLSQDLSKELTNTGHVNQLTNQSTNQPTNQPTSQPASQLANQPTIQPTNLFILLFFILCCVCVFYLQGCKCAMCVWCLWRTEEDSDPLQLKA